MGSKIPKWVMCGVCSEVIWAGPSTYAIEGVPIPRECGCRATRVLPTMERGFVQWDGQAYAAAAHSEASAAFNKEVKRKAEAAAERAKGFGLDPDQIKEAYTDAYAEAEKGRDKYISDSIAQAPTEPLVEYAEDGEVLTAPPPIPAQPTTINKIYKSHIKDLESGKEI